MPAVESHSRARLATALVRGLLVRLVVLAASPP